jgi:tetratricopeptide (TPR) repeat protein
VKKQIILASAGIILVATLFLFGKRSVPKKPVAKMAAASEKMFDIQQFIISSKASLTASQAVYVLKLENGISRGDVIAQQIKAYQGLSGFWKDSAKLFEPYAFYLAEASKLENSEKNLTFAAQLFLENLRLEHDAAKLNWETTEAIELFEKALEHDPENADLKIGLGSAYVFGKGGSGDPTQTMKGIQQLLSVVRKDSNNMKAQMVLGIGGTVSGQFDKAIERLLKVVSAEPENLEAMLFLADAYAAKGEKNEAIKWYNACKHLKNSKEFLDAIDEKIKSL